LRIRRKNVPREDDGTCSNPPRLGSQGRKESLIAAVRFYKRPTVTAATIFLLTLSGPPRFRIRDPEASLRGDLDWVVVLHLVVWGSAGVWVLWQIAKRFQAKRPLLLLLLPQILGLAMILLLAVSSFVSDAPALTAFKVYQMLVSLLFTQIFTEQFGVWTSLKALLWGNGILCVAISICAVFAPASVWIATEVNPDPTRLRGDLIASTGAVSVLAMILLLTTVRKIWTVMPLSLLGCFFALLALSLMRTAYIAASVFFFLVLLKRPSIRPLRRLAYFLCLTLLMACVFERLPTLGNYRDPATISDLGDRIGLWRYLTTLTLTRSPWLGLGYYSASRIHGLEYNPGLGTAHSMFFEVLTGGGVLSLSLLISLCLVLSIYLARLLYARRDRICFATCSLFLTCLLFGSMGEEIDSGPVAMGFWYCVAVLPWLYELREVRGVLISNGRRSQEFADGPQRSAVPAPELS
jgi:hypothetical protein